MMNERVLNASDSAAAGGEPPRTKTTARLLLPNPGLGACVFAGVERNTLGAELSDAERFNYYPATPMAVISWIFEGELRMVETRPPADASVLGPPLPRLVLSGPQRRPRASWSPGPVHALSVAFYPEALASLLGTPIEPLLDRIVPLDAVAPAAMVAAGNALFAASARTDPFRLLEERLGPLWRGARAASAAPLMGDWIRALATRAMFSRTGAGVRQLQRRIKNWTGQSRQDLQLFVRAEEALVRVAESPPDGSPDLARLACDASFADQSHMGRTVRRVTGISPARLLELIRRDEAFWFYRVIEGHLRETRRY